MSFLAWETSLRWLALAETVDELGQRLNGIADRLGPRLLGFGQAPGAWRALGLKVVRRDLGGVSGYCVPGDRNRVVQVSATDDPRRQRFTVAHEMAHLLLADVDRGALNLRHRQEEELCDSYASRLLIPRCDLAEHFPQAGKGVDDLLGICRRYGVSISAAIGAVGADFAAEQRVIFACSYRGHSRRPDQLAYRAFPSHCGDIYIPDEVSLPRLGLGVVAQRLAESAVGGRPCDRVPNVDLQLWRPKHSPRSGRLQGRAQWSALILGNGISLIEVEVSEASRVWAQPKNSLIAAQGQ